MAEPTINERLTRIEERLSAMIAVTDERWARVEQTITFGDTQSSQAISLLTNAVDRLEKNQREQGRELRERDTYGARLSTLESHFADDNAAGVPIRLRKLEDALTSARAVMIAAIGLGVLGGGGIAAALLKVLGG